MAASSIRSRYDRHVLTLRETCSGLSAWTGRPESHDAPIVRVPVPLDQSGGGGLPWSTGGIVLEVKVRSRSVLTMFTTMALAVGGGGIVSPVTAAEDAIGTGTEEAPRDIVITMTDQLRFDPEEIVVMAGETVRFVLDNPTAAAHDFTLGDLEAQELHNAQMAAGMTHDDDADHDDEMADDDADHDDEMADDDADHDDEMADDDADHDDEMADDEMADDEMADDEMADDEMADDEMADDGHGEAGEGGLPAPVTIAPGDSVTVLATFEEPGEVLIGCHQPGHWEAGMRGTITVVAGE
jgi:uncharacterized cupredoxin-like copper-binding protein